MIAIPIQKISRTRFDQFLSLNTRIPNNNPATILMLAYSGPVDEVNPNVLIPYPIMRSIVPTQPIMCTVFLLNFILVIIP